MCTCHLTKGSIPIHKQPTIVVFLCRCWIVLLNTVDSGRTTVSVSSNTKSLNRRRTLADKAEVKAMPQHANNSYLKYFLPQQLCNVLFRDGAETFAEVERRVLYYYIVLYCIVVYYYIELYCIVLYCIQTWLQLVGQVQNIAMCQSVFCQSSVILLSIGMSRWLS